MFPKKTHRWLTGTWKMSGITNHQRNANQNHNELSPHTCQNGHHKNQQIIDAGKDVEIRTPVHCWWECIWVQPVIVEKSMEGFSKHEKQNYHMTQQFHSWVYSWQTQKTLIWKDMHILMSRTALFTTAKIEMQPRCPSTEG